MTEGARRRVVVIGGGIAGLAAAHRLRERAPHLDVILVDQSDRPGGKLRTVELAGGPVERGAESFLSGDPAGGPSAAVRLAEQVGLGDAIVHPATSKAAVAAGGTLHDLPPGTLMGIPVDTDPPERPAAAPLLRPGEDVTVGALVRPRRGDLVVDRFVEPLLGGVYAGRADHLSLRMALPALADAAERSDTLTGAVRAVLAARRSTPGAPVFSAIRGGMSRLVDAVAATLPDVRLGLPVRDLRRDGSRWRLTIGSTHSPSTLAADAVVLAVPATPAARLLSTAGLRGVPLDYASVGLVALALPATKLPELSGLLVPATEGFAVKAVTFFDQKWSHLRRSGLTIVRASVGRAGDEAQLQRSDADLLDLVRAEVARLIGADRLPDPVDAAVFRWGGALPQYAPHHRDRVGQLRAELTAHSTAPGHPPLTVAGAAYDGVGIPACVTSGRTAADALLEALEG
ncbi:protoporphyrinogen oxidase [Dactylosporangium sp. NPDC006015]|uniref:protoporphyrinogen oxidase n=1 Tax=Dactylosporangium sp. NPDC006015 TaxID=3154576 RepID=UPI0033B70C19